MTIKVSINGFGRMGRLAICSALSMMMLTINRGALQILSIVLDHPVGAGK